MSSMRLEMGPAKSELKTCNFFKNLSCGTTCFDTISSMEVSRFIGLRQDRERILFNKSANLDI